MNNQTAFILIVAMGLATMATRVLPFVIFTRRETVPPFILYLGDVLPFASIGLLIVYCLKDVNFIAGSHGIPEAIAMAVVIASYLWKRNTIMSMLLGTILYMVLVQQIFV